MKRWSRSIVTWIVAIVIIAFAFVGIIFFKSLSKVDDASEFVVYDYNTCKKFKNQSVIDLAVYKSQAYFDHVHEEKQSRKGTMSCYCMQMFASEKFNPLSLKKILFNDVGGKEETRTICWDWVTEYSL